MADQTKPVQSPEEAGGLPDYGAGYYRNYWGGGGPYERNERWLAFFGDVADGIIRDLHPASVLDAGCALGFLVEALHKRGVDAWGIDVSEYAISEADATVRDRCSVGSLTEPLPRRYDLITCIEVVEHIPAAEADKAIANLCAATDRILLSTTPQDYGEPTHLNVQQPESWSAALAQQGFFRDLDRDFSYLSPWAALYTRREEPVAETVRRYDRAWWRLRQEATEVRASLLSVQDRLSELEAGGGFDNRPGLMEDLDRQEEEILKLRDLLVGKDAELGVARGQLAAAEESTRTLQGLAGRIQGRIPGGMRLSGAILRRLKSRRG
jgi:SAM-dependent methyltransferase